MDKNDFTNEIQKLQSVFHSVVPFSKEGDKLLLMKFSLQNKEMSPSIFNDTQKFIIYINENLKASHARYGIGGYNEDRTIYSRSPLFHSEPEGQEPRTLHLGIDIWGEAKTPVMAPCDGVVHSFADNHHYGDFGATIILTHNFGGLIFNTLYGHLSINSLKGLSTGALIQRGAIFAEFGIPSENGQWPSHLHFQIILDIANYKGDYPGVCKNSEKENYLANCPDPDNILQMIQFAHPT
ncbi:MAG: hypothetical protein NVS9B7_22880 [Flavisolibacter sp.]